jgi:antitoxin component of MazEF toxin-antitoxin module
MATAAAGVRKSGSKVRRVGGSYIVTLPKAMCEELEIEAGTPVQFQLQEDRAIVIEPVQRRRTHLRPRRPITALLKQGRLNQEIKGWDDQPAGKGEPV